MTSHQHSPSPTPYSHSSQIDDLKPHHGPTFGETFQDASGPTSFVEPLHSLHSPSLTKRFGTAQTRGTVMLAAFVSAITGLNADAMQPAHAPSQTTAKNTTSGAQPMIIDRSENQFSQEDSPSDSDSSPESKSESVPESLAFTAQTITGETKKLGDYAGQVVLVINTASRCGFTKQYEGLQKLHAQYAEQGLAVLGFPSDNFGGQELDTDDEILSFCTSRFAVDFDLFTKTDVKGENAHPFFTYLTTNAPDDGKGQDIRWNFEKFLLDRHGQIIARYRSGTNPTDDVMIKAIEKALAEEAQ